MPGRRWTPEEDALLGTMPDDEAAEALRRTRTAVHKRRCDLGIPSATRTTIGPFTSAEDAVIRAFTNNGVPSPAIAAALDRSAGSVRGRRHLLRQRGLMD